MMDGDREVSCADREKKVARHYGDKNLAASILAKLESVGISQEALQADDLAPFEELHIGGRQATKYLIERLMLKADHHVLDVGCGIGGAVRYIATTIGCRVTGIDLTPSFIQAAKTLTRAVGLDDRAFFDVGSALAMPYDEAQYDAVVSIHVAMNIADRVSLYREMSRVLKPGGIMGLFDIMRKTDGELIFPVPWADTPAISHLVTAEEMVKLLNSAGMVVTEIEDRTDVAVDFFQKILTDTQSAESFPAPHIAMQDGNEKLRNTLANIEAGHIAPVLLLATKAGVEHFE